MTTATTTQVNAGAQQQSPASPKTINLDALNLTGGLNTSEPILDWDFVIKGHTQQETVATLMQGFVATRTRLQIKDTTGYPQSTSFAGLADFSEIDGYVHQVINDGILVGEMFEIKLSNSSFAFLEKMNELEGVFEELKSIEVISHILGKVIKARTRFTEVWKPSKRPSGRTQYKGVYMQLAWHAEGLDQSLVFDYTAKEKSKASTQTPSQTPAQQGGGTREF